MKEISASTARQLIAEGKAGYYAVNANPPIPHKVQMAVHTGGKWYLVSSVVLKVTELGPTYITSPVDGSKLPKMLFNVELHDDEELAGLLKKEMEAAKDLDMGLPIPSKYTGHPGRPERLLG